MCKHNFPCEGNPGDWKCAGCNLVNTARCQRCEQCQTARFVAPAFEQHNETFQRAAALFLELRAAADPAERAAVRGQWEAVCTSEGMVSELSDGGNVMMNGGAGGSDPWELACTRTTQVHV